MKMRGETTDYFHFSELFQLNFLAKSCIVEAVSGVSVYIDVKG